MDETVDGKKLVNEKVGIGNTFVSPKAGEVLHWILNEGLIEDYKWLITEKKSAESLGQDIYVSTPETVKTMLYHGFLNDDLNLVYLDLPESHTSNLVFIGENIEQNESVNLYRLLVEGYLTREDFSNGNVLPFIPDEHGINALEGEIKRYEANMSDYFVRPQDVIIIPEDVYSFCRTYDLNDSVERLMDKLNFE